MLTQNKGGIRDIEDQIPLDMLLPNLRIEVKIPGVTLNRF